MRTERFQFAQASFPGSIAVVRGDPKTVSSEGVTTKLYVRQAAGAWLRPKSATRDQQLFRRKGTGPLADRLNRQALMIGADVIRGVLALGFFLIHRSSQVWLVYVLAGSVTATGPA